MLLLLDVRRASADDLNILSPALESLRYALEELLQDGEEFLPRLP